jgi:prephenate dehydrogenase
VVNEVIGFDRDAAAVVRAQALGAIDRAASSAAEAVRGADLVLLAVPVGAMKETLSAIAAAVPAHALITDVGSTKRSVIDAARAQLGAHGDPSFGRFVPGHPIAGRELPGIEHADGMLFAGKRYVSTPVEQTSAEALARIEALWQAAGAKVARMDADEHDRIFAAVSHLPHLLAFAYMNAMAEQPMGQEYLSLAGPGFRDFTRIAASDPTIWRDILLSNREEVLKQSEAFRHALEQMERQMRDWNGPALQNQIQSASDSRSQWQLGGKSSASR